MTATSRFLPKAMSSPDTRLVYCGVAQCCHFEKNNTNLGKAGVCFHREFVRLLLSGMFTVKGPSDLEFAMVLYSRMILYEAQGTCHTDPRTRPLIEAQ